MVSTCFNSLWISYDFVMPASVSHPLRGWGCAFHPVCWSSHPRKSFAALRSPSSPNHHTTCGTKSWSDGVMGWTPWTNGWCYVCYVMLLCLKGFFAIEKSVETCSLYRFSQSIFNGFSMFDSNTSSSRGFTARFMPQDAPGCPRWPDDWMVSWIDHLPFLGPRVRVTRIIQILAADLRMRTERERAGCEAVNFWYLLWPFPFFLPFFCFKNMS